MPLSLYKQTVDRDAAIERERADIAVELGSIDGKIEAARVKALRERPSVASDGAGTVVRRLEQRKEKLVRRDAALIKERAALAIVAAERAAERQKELIRELAAKGSANTTRLRDILKKAGAIHDTFVEVYDLAVAAARDQEELCDQARQSGLDPDTIPELAPGLSPFPVDAFVFFSQFWADAADPGNLGRRELGKDVLLEFVADLRPLDRVRLRGVESAERPPFTV